MPKGAGETLRRLRGDKPRSAVAEAVGISERALQSYECDERVPRDKVKKALASYYHKSVEYIFFCHERPQSVTEGE